MKNQDLLDAITLVSFMVGIANYNENLTQSDKDDIMNRLDEQTKDILLKVSEQLEYQNKLLNEILTKIKDIKKLHKRRD